MCIELHIGCVVLVNRGLNLVHFRAADGAGATEEMDGAAAPDARPPKRAYDDDDPSKTRPLHQGEKLAALGIPAHFSYNLPVVTAAQPGHTAAGCAWAPSQAALVMIPLCDAWRACGGPFYPPESARRWAAL